MLSPIKNGRAALGDRPRPKTHKQDVADITELLLANAELDKIRTRHDGALWYKYLDIEKYVPYNIRLCRTVGLHQMQRQRILDIGCGGGLFMYCARYYGHAALGVDVEDELLGEMAEAFGVDRRIAPVQRYQRLLIEDRFDLITCIGTVFDRNYDATGLFTGMWSCPEWRFFLSDLERLLSPDGRVFLRLNRGKEAKAKNEYFYDERLQQAFAHGILRSSEILFDRKGLALAVRRLDE